MPRFSSPGMDAKYFSISRETSPSVLRHTAWDLRVLEALTSTTSSPRVSFTKSRTSFSDSCLSSEAFFSSSDSSPRSPPDTSQNSLPSYSLRVLAANSSMSSPKHKMS